MRALIAGIVALAVAAIVVLIVAGGSVAGKGIALALFGVACVVAVSAVFLAVGRSEDEDRRAAEGGRPPPPPPPGEGQPAAGPPPPPAPGPRRALAPPRAPFAGGTPPVSSG